jgi:hypothetical protein
MSLRRRLFGGSEAEVWRQLCAEIGGRYVEGKRFREDKVEVTHGEWIVTFDTYVVSTGKTTSEHTRLRAPYVNPEGFRFTVYRRGLLSDVAKWLGMQDVTVGYPDFDRDFIIKGTSPARLCELFADQRLRELIAQQPDIHFSVKDDEGWFGPRFPEKVDELCFISHGVIEDVARLEQLYRLFARTLDQLCRMGSAYDDAPGVAL